MLKTMENGHHKAYAKAGVDVDLGNRVKSGLAKRVKLTHRPGVLSSIGGFGGLFDGKFRGYKDPVLVSSIDGVGTKLRVAIMAGRHDTVGTDLVNHCVNDIAVLGAEPLFFLDYVGTGKLDPDVFLQVIGGLVQGCRKAGCALIGGETAQMPGVYQAEDYDLVGTIVGVVEKSKVINGSRIKPGDVLIGFPSSGLHTNGYSLARKILFDQMELKINDTLPGSKLTIADELLKVHINYQPTLKKIAAKIDIKGLAHITGGGLVDNLPRILPRDTSAEIGIGSWPVLPIFQLMADEAQLERYESHQVFNMGIGMVAVVSKDDASKILKIAKAYRIGEIVKGSGKVILV
ncbi:MAG: phosphoribosylformylglycinamidine cyclo-ligase [Verrucomicrobiota bacterium]